jgi:hypothetical protein
MSGARVVLTALSVSSLFSQTHPEIPRMLHWCSQHCSTWTLDSGPPLDKPHYGSQATGGIVIVQKFGNDGVLMERTDFGQYPGKAVLHGQLSPDGNSIVNGTIDWIYHPCCGLGSAKFQAAWGAALNTVPGSDAERERMRRLNSPDVTVSASPRSATSSSPNGTNSSPPSPPLRAQIAPAGAGHRTNLQGEYYAITGSVYTARVIHPIRIMINGDNLSAVRLVIKSAPRPEDAKPDGEPFLRGTYDADVFTAQIQTPQGTWLPVKVTVVSPDHVRIGSMDYYRFAESVAKMDCDPENRQHVEHAYALQRGLDALREKKMELSACWFRVGAMAGNRVAQSNYGTSLYLGRGVKQDYTEAFVWFKKSAVQGDFEGELNLARLYHLGLGTPKDDANAEYWFHVAARNPAAPERMKDAEGFRNALTIIPSLLTQEFTRSPFCDETFTETAQEKKRRLQIVAEDHIDCDIRIPIETGPPHPQR